MDPYDLDKSCIRYTSVCEISDLLQKIGVGLRFFPQSIVGDHDIGVALRRR